MTLPQQQDPAALFDRGLQQFQAGNYSTALADFDSALTISPNNPRIWEKRTLVLQKLGRYAAALASNKIALSFYSNPIEELLSAEEWFDLGYQQAVEGDMLGAIACFDKALEIDIDHRQAWYNGALALYHIGHLEQAVVCFDRALELDPKDKDAWYSRGIALNNLEKFEEAVVSFDKALEIDPDDYQIWHNRTLALCRLGRLGEALAASRPQ